jgi:hypothetical protein
MLFYCFFHAAQTASCSLQLCFASMASRGLVIPHFRPTGPQPFRCRFERRAVSGPYSRRPGHVTTHHFSENHSFTLLFHSCSRVYRAGTQQYRHIVGWGMYVPGRIKGRGVAMSKNLPSLSACSCPPPPILTQVIGASRFVGSLLSFPRHIV